MAVPVPLTAVQNILTRFQNDRAANALITNTTLANYLALEGYTNAVHKPVLGVAQQNQMDLVNAVLSHLALVYRNYDYAKANGTARTNAEKYDLLIYFFTKLRDPTVTVAGLLLLTMATKVHITAR
jgi:hypothetical protein